MPKRRSVVELRDVIRRLRAQQGIRKIHQETGVHRTIIRALRNAAEARGWLSTEAPLPSEEQVQEARRTELPAKSAGHPLEAFATQIEQWVQAGHSYVVMHQLLKERYPCSEATLRRFVQKRFPHHPRVSVARPTVAGQDMEVDFGYLGITYDPIGRRNRKTWLFSGRLRHSRLAWREPVFEQKGYVFFQCHMHAFEYFGGIPVSVIPDNLKAAVMKASWEDPLVNRSYRQLAEHYGFLISVCPPRRPRAKGGVENDIKYVKHNFWPLFVEQQRERGQEVPRYDELVQSLPLWTAEVSERRIVRGVGRSPREIFECEEHAALRPLPPERWDPTSWAVAKVATDFRIQFQKGFYTVPYRYIGEQVNVCGTSRTVRIFFDLKQIALHQRVEKAWQTRSNPLHAPEYIERYLAESRAGLLAWAQQLGEPVGKVVEQILQQKAVDGLRPTRALLHLASRYSAQRLSRACDRALRFATPCYASVKNILVSNLDRLPAEAAMDERGQRVFRFSRRGTDFDPPLYGDPTN
jgi:transposase